MLRFKISCPLNNKGFNLLNLLWINLCKLVKGYEFENKEDYPVCWEHILFCFTEGI